MILSPWRSGLALGGLTGLAHVVWAALVALGGAQFVVDLVLRLHFLQVTVAIAPFDLGLAAVLVALTFAVGFVLGLVFALLWNRLHQEAPAAAQATA